MLYRIDGRGSWKMINNKIKHLEMMGYECEVLINKVIRVKYSTGIFYVCEMVALESLMNDYCIERIVKKLNLKIALEVNKMMEVE